MKPAPVSILLVEDNPGDARLIREMLVSRGLEGFALHIAGDLASALRAAGDEVFDVVVLDLGLPDAQGLDGLKQVGLAVPESPVIVLTGNSDSELALSAVQAGAQDYLVKGEISPDLLIRACRYAIERHRAESQLRDLNAALEDRVRERTAELEQTTRVAEATAAENARMFSEAQEVARLNGALNGVDSTVHSTLQIDRVMQLALEAGVKALDCDAGAVEMVDDEEWVVRYQHGFPGDLVGTRLSKEEAPDATSAALFGSSRGIEYSLDDQRLSGVLAGRYDLKSVMAVPLLARGQVLGSAIFYTRAARHFNDAEIDFGQKFGSTVSLALENARLYESEHRIANTLQAALLAMPEHLPGLEFAYAYHSATEATRVGGDFYDLFEIGPDKIGVTIGDVAGKGLEAAALTSLIKNTIRAHAMEGCKTPSQILALTNEVVHDATAPETFATVFFGVLDRTDGRLIYSNAGHTTAVVVSDEAVVATLAGTAPIVGGFAAVEFGQAEVCLAPGELLFLYTDGLTEARRDGEFYGERRLLEFLSAADAVADDIVTDIAGYVVSYSGGVLRDDLAILAVALVDGAHVRCP
jgi:serine phosphatase RsbU (regulator of sigma subunit)/DNA-binding response OmpR family regulator